MLNKISNCVVNLAEDKEVVIGKKYDSLKNGGELYFSDNYLDRRLPKEIGENEVLYEECLGGALYYKDFERIARRVGFSDPRVVNKRIVTIENDDIFNLAGNCTFYSITYRLWKLSGLEDACEDYGHVAIYRGGISYAEYSLELDDGHVFYKNRPELVCGNTARMLQETRFVPYFELIGNFSEHLGHFKDCGAPKPEMDDGESCS